ncbi:MAG: helix-turn-helix domain-containing protein [Bacteroidetes bacterium]|nr:helix-turn-helix domain-containing protein [Bacteroidota bacterium]MDA0888549.1 helix-turn-helix domain-containing protein [Bacteroidota bacterium]MDA1084192.1 helix-turn-helix domain-containing protein [Bacteroidota bacterium]
MTGFIGTATESMIRIFKKFEQSGLVTSEGRAIRILDEERLFNIANGIEHSVL